MADIVSIGEMLIDFTSKPSENGEVIYKQNAGGAPANVAVMAAKLGVKTAFIGKIGNDFFGKYLRGVLAENNVDTNGLAVDRENSTTLAFVNHDENGERNFVFYRKKTADTNLLKSDIRYRIIDGAKIVHFGSLMLTNEPSKSSVIDAIIYAKNAGKVITYDPNFRESLWNSKEEAVETMQSVLPYVDIIKVSESELQILTECGNLLPAIAKLLNLGVKIICITQGAKGSIIATRKGIENSEAFSPETIDTLGAGDSFFGAFLSQIVKSGKNLEQMDMEDLLEFSKYANACGALTSTKSGAIPAMPSDEEILNLIKNI